MTNKPYDTCPSCQQEPTLEIKTRLKPRRYNPRFYTIAIVRKCANAHRWVAYTSDQFIDVPLGLF